MLPKTCRLRHLGGNVSWYSACPSSSALWRNQEQVCMNRCKQCGERVWESETTCVECEAQSTALDLRNDAPAALSSSHAGETFPALDKVEPKPASANVSP